MLVLGIETSCDETGVALYSGERGLIDHEVFTQAPLHQLYGGVVPEIASRDHCRRLLPLIKGLLARQGIAIKEIDAIAYTAGPGLVGALMVGAALGRTLAYALAVPAVGVHHMEAHLLAPLLEPDAPTAPFVALLVSGGHTLLVQVTKVGDYSVIGQSVDDAAGEAFDKVSKLLGLGYPGGPQVERLARDGRAGRFQFPRPMVNRPGLDFSFSGLKTFAANTLATAGNDLQTKADIALAFSEAVIDTLYIKCRRALEATKLKTLVAAGGVSANQQLRNKLEVLGREANIRIHYPRAEFCTDNAAMIALAGHMRLHGGDAAALAFHVKPRWPFKDLY